MNKNGRGNRQANSQDRVMKNEVRIWDAIAEVLNKYDGERFFEHYGDELDDMSSEEIKVKAMEFAFG